MMRTLVTCSLMLLGTMALAFNSAIVPADGTPVIIDGFTPGVSYHMEVWGTLWYRSLGSVTNDVQREVCFERSGGQRTPAQTFGNSFGVAMCGETTMGWGRINPLSNSVTFQAPAARMVVWVDAPPYEEAQGYLTVRIRSGRGHTGAFHPNQLRHCILRRPLPEQPTAGAPVCFEFEAVYAYHPSSWRLASIDFDTCLLTEHGARSGWEIDPIFGGPHPGHPAHMPGNVFWIWHDLVPHGGDYYGCRSPRAEPLPAPVPPSPDPLPAPLPMPAPPAPAPSPMPAPTPSPAPRPGPGGTGVDFDPRQLDMATLAPYGAFWSNSCPWAFDGECDEPGIGTGACLPGTDAFDCGFVSFDWSNSCPWAFDGECDEPGIGTGHCLPGTDTFDCYGVRRDDPTPEPPLPPEPERREHALERCEVWSVANSGGAEGTVDLWDISDIPDGAVFDLRFDARSEPDRYRVMYGGFQVYDSGWRGASRYDGDARYDGGIVGPGRGEALDVFVKRAHASFTVTV
ncbi:MAG: hypothetical protein EA416_17930, partial [Trueperaceae bacterium]